MDSKNKPITTLSFTPFHKKTSEICVTNEWVRWAGYTVVNRFTTTELEYTAIRNTCGVFDITPMYKYKIIGKDARQYLDRLVTRNIDKLQPNNVLYIFWCNEQGKVIDDGTLFCISENEYRICSGERNLVWFQDSAFGFDVKVEDITPDFALLAIQGPTSCIILEKMGMKKISELGPFAMREYVVDGQTITITRTGFTGDLGYEVWINPKDALYFWEKLFSIGKLYGIRAAGLAALDLTRIESGFVVTNADFINVEQALRPNRARSPFELNMGWIVDLNKGFFNGKNALLEEKKNGSKKILVGLDIEGDKPAVGAVVYNEKKQDIGIVTAAMWSPTPKKNIAYAMLNHPYGTLIKKGILVEIYHPEELEYRKIWAKCKIVKRQFYNPKRKTKEPTFANN